MYDNTCTYAVKEICYNNKNSPNVSPRTVSQDKAVYNFLPLAIS